MFGVNIDIMEWILRFYIIIIMISMFFSLIFTIFGIKLYKKANKKSSEALIPIYNLFVLMQITELPIYYFLLFLFPIFNILLIIRIEYKLYKLFNTSFKFFLGLVFVPFVFVPLLSFGKYKYKRKSISIKEEEEEEEKLDDIPILMSEEELNKLNSEEINTPEEDLDVDSIFKSDLQIQEEDITPYRAIKAEEDLSSDIYDEIVDKPKREKVEILDFKEIKNKKKEKDKIEIIDL